VELDPGSRFLDLRLGHDGAWNHRSWVHNGHLGPIMSPRSHLDLGCLRKAMHCRWSLWILHSGGNQLETLRATKDSIDSISVFCEERAMLKRRRWEEPTSEKTFAS